MTAFPSETCDETGGRARVARWFLVATAAVGLTAGVQRCAEATPTVVFGNLGNAGDGGLSSTSTTTGPSQPVTQSLAAAFTTGTNARFLELVSVTLGLAGETQVPRTIQLWTSANGLPGSPIAGLLSNSVQVDPAPQKLYTFQFPSQPALQPLTTYWIVPEDPILWYVNGFDSSPIGRNSSDYTAPPVTYARLGTGEGGTAWYDTGTRYSVSVVAVPEPSSKMLAGMGFVATACLMLWRTSRRTAAMS